MQDLDKAIELKPNFPEAFAYRGHLFEIRGDEEHAAHDFERAGYFHLLKGECDKAIVAYTAALEHASKMAAALFGRGRCELQLANEQAGNADIRAAHAIDSAVDTELTWPKTQ